MEKETVQGQQMSLFEDTNKVKNVRKVSKGALLEFRLQRLLFFMGYFTKRGIIMKTSADDLADEITDLDAYGTYIHKDFSVKRIWADCKSGKAKPRERISWIKGIRTSVKIDDVIFVKSGVRINTKQFARRSGILVLDNDTISKLEKDFGITENDWRGSWDYNTQYDNINKLKKIVAYNGRDLKNIAQFIESNYWVFDYYARIKKCITGLKQLYDFHELAKEDEKYIIKWAMYELISLFTLATLNICREVYYLSDVDKKVIINDGMISGEISAKKRAELVDATYKMAIGLVKQQIPDFKPMQLDLNVGLNAPEYCNKLIDLVNRITNNPLNYFDILRILDFSLMEYELKDVPINEEDLQELFNNYRQVKGSVKTILHFVCDVCNIPIAFFDLLKK